MVCLHHRWAKGGGPLIMTHHHFPKIHCCNDDVILSNTYGHQTHPLPTYESNFKTSIPSQSDLHKSYDSNTYLYVIKVAVIWMLQFVRFKLKVDGEPLLGGDGPHAVNGRVVGDTVLAPLVRDVSMPYEPLVARLIWERATSDVWNLT